MPRLASGITFWASKHKYTRVGCQRYSHTPQNWSRFELTGPTPTVIALKGDNIGYEPQKSVSFTVTGAIRWGWRRTVAPARLESPQKPAARAKSSGKAARVDINSASREQLDAIPGVGEAYAQKIIEGRPYRTHRDPLMREIVLANVTRRFPIRSLRSRRQRP